MCSSLRYFIVLCTLLMPGWCASQQLEDTNSKKTKLLFKDRGTKSAWKKWFMDGTQASVTNSNQGMLFEAGKEYGNDSCHAVLWTKKSFEGNILIEFDYTRTDTTTRNVNILYFHATGKGNEEYPEDIYLWRDKRTVPKMSSYFLNMNAYHISYAAFDADKYSKNNDYIRLRRYDPSLNKLAGTEIAPDALMTGLFLPHITYHVEISLLQGQVVMKVTSLTNPLQQLICNWDVSLKPILDHGRIGIRHMYTRNARYKNFKVWSLD